MAALTDLAELFAGSERPAGNLLSPEDILAQAVAATRMYAGYGKLSTPPDGDIGAYTVVSVSEWAVIRPLFLLYVERENALQLEASRGLGVDVFGRDSVSVAADIMQAEMELPVKAFCRPILTV
ncbi:MAG TPA: hypothetical protein VIG97_02355 [Luteimonas sp.]